MARSAPRLMRGDGQARPVQIYDRGAGRPHFRGLRRSVAANCDRWRGDWSLKVPRTYKFSQATQTEDRWVINNQAVRRYVWCSPFRTGVDLMSPSPTSMRPRGAFRRHMVLQGSPSGSRGGGHPICRLRREFGSAQGGPRIAGLQHQLRMCHASYDKDPLDVLKQGGERVNAWLKSRARLADGQDSQPPLTSDNKLISVVARRRLMRPDWQAVPSSRFKSAWLVMSVGLLSHLCRSRQQDIARQLDIATGSVHTYLQDFRQLIESDAAFLHEATTLVSETLA